MLTAWRKNRSTYHIGDADMEIDDDYTAAEEEEALRLPRAKVGARVSARGTLALWEQSTFMDKTAESAAAHQLWLQQTGRKGTPLYTVGRQQECDRLAGASGEVGGRKER